MLNSHRQQGGSGIFLRFRGSGGAWYTAFIVSCLCFGLHGCATSEQEKNDADEGVVLIYEESFDVADTTAWVVESADGASLKECIGGGDLALDVRGGITVWNTTRFSADVIFEFAATVVKAGGPNDRVSDLNCFWMATDPAFPEDFFHRSAWRGGTFWNYYTLDLYYVGYGGHDNTRTRMRRYDGDLPPPPPVIGEYDDAAHLITPNRENVVRITCINGVVTYSMNGEQLFQLRDPEPYKSGYFGFRTTHNHMKVHYFKVFAVPTGQRP